MNRFERNQLRVMGQRPKPAEFSITEIVGGMIIAWMLGMLAECASAQTTCPPGEEGTAVLSWRAPTTNTDGTPLTDLSAFKIYYGDEPGLYPNTAQINNPTITTYRVECLSDGTWYFAATAINSSGIESVFSNVADKDILNTFSEPEPPGGFKVLDTMIYTINWNNPDEVRFIPVGTVPGDSVCDPQQPIGGWYQPAGSPPMNKIMYVIPGAALVATWFGNVKPNTVWGECS